MKAKKPKTTLIGPLKKPLPTKIEELIYEPLKPANKKEEPALWYRTLANSPGPAGTGTCAISVDLKKDSFPGAPITWRALCLGTL